MKNKVKKIFKGVNNIRIFPLVILVFILVFVFGNVLKSLISASGTPWVQTDWSGGVGASTTSQYQSGTNVNISTAGEISILPLEKLSNTNFESDTNSWDVGTSPSSISGLSLWLKADSIVGLNDGDTVSSWTDQSSYVNNAIQLTANLMPLYKTNILNGKPVVRFDGSNDEMAISQGITHGTTFVVGKRSSTSSPFAEVGGGSIGNRRGLIGLYYPAYATYDEYYVNGTSVPNGGSGAINTQLIFTGRSPSTPVNSTTFRLGYGSPSYAYLNGDIAEMIIYDTSLSSTNRQLIESYLQNKYGISAGYLTVTRDVATTYASSAGSAKIVAGSLGGNFTQSVNVGDTDSYNLNVYAYTTGAAITSSDAELYYNGSVISTTYTSVGGGWYKLTGTLTGANSTRQYGIQVKGGKTIYLDNFSVNKFTPATLTSNIYDTTTASDYGLLTYTATTPAGSSVSVKVRTGNQANLSDASNFNVCAATSSGVDLSGGCSPDNKRYVQYEVTLTGNGLVTPTFSDITINNSPSDVTSPTTNASSVIMYRTNGGATVNSQAWVSSLSPKFSWTAGTDETGIKGYCLRLVNKSSLAPNFDDTSPTDLTNITFNSSGLIDSANTPVATTGSNCSFIINSTEIDFSNQSYRLAPWLTTSSDLYYLFVKVIDGGNNMYTGPATFFKFKFDSTVPTNVAYISSASGTFGNVNDMNFSWPVVGGTASSDNDSGLLGWQYQINSSNGTWQGTNVDSSLGVNYIPSSYSSFPYFLTSGVDGPNIQIGNNVIYFRTIDVAGNVSSPATLRTANISFGGNAPTFPSSCDNTTGVTITPTSSVSNSFSLSWPAATPAPGRTISNYFYMINTEPPATLATINSNSATYKESNTTSVSESALSGVVKGSNTVYVVVVDDIDIYSSTNCLKGVFTLNSNLPDPPSSLSVSDASIKSASLWRASLAWGEPAYKGTGILSYKIDRSEDGSNWTNIGTTSGNAYLDTVPQSKIYYWRVSTIDNTVESQNSPSYSNGVSLIPKGVFTVAPTLTSTPQALDVSTKRAKISWTTSREGDSKIAYGVKSGEYYSEEVYNSEASTDHLISLSNLSPSTLYYYKAKWTDEDGNTGTSEELSFRTLEAPRVREVSVTNISVSSALIKYTARGANSVKIYFGKSTDFGGVKEVPTSPIEAPYTSQLTGLEDGTKYIYKINSLDADGNEYQGTVLDFTTLPRPRLFDINFSQIRGTAQPSVLVSWKSNTEVSTVVSYYVSGNEKNVKDVTNPNLVKDLNRAVLRELDPETNYGMVIKARDRVGNEVVSDVYQFTTAIDTRPPTISGMKVESVVPAKSGQSTGAQIIVSWNTDKPSTSQVEFGEGTGGNYSQKTQEETTLKQNHLVVISDLTPSKVYSIRALSRDKAGNIGKSSGNNTLTPKAVDSALDIVITILSDAFSFLSGINK
jgi:hypothetical protein